MDILLQWLGEEAEIKNWSAARVFTYKEIKKATNNFKNVIGRGSFGSVYLGKLADGKMVAVKVRFDSSKLGADSFLNEVQSLDSESSSILVNEIQSFRLYLVKCFDY